MSFKKTDTDSKVQNDFTMLKNIVNEAEHDMTESTEKGNAAAGTRLREAMHKGKVLMQDIRTGTQAAKNERKAARK